MEHVSQASFSCSAGNGKEMAGWLATGVRMQHRKWVGICSFSFLEGLCSQDDVYTVVLRERLIWEKETCSIVPVSTLFCNGNISRVQGMLVKPIIGTPRRRCPTSGAAAPSGSNKREVGSGTRKEAEPDGSRKNRKWRKMR